ncbi:MAG: oligosaccharide flippase family protein [Bacteroidota bacterium]|jgi:O-antigen/teichoic acid export membrane protein
MKKDIVKSSLTGIVQFIVSTLLVLITIPVFVRICGMEQYGVFSLISIVGSVNTFANLGLNTSLVRFLAKQGKTNESTYDIIANLVILFSIIIPICFCGFIFKEWILVKVFNVPLYLMPQSVWLFSAMLVGNIFILIGQTFTAILESQQKIYLTNMYQMIYNVLYWGLILIILLIEPSLKLIGLVMLIASMVWFCIVSISAMRIWNGISIKRPTLREFSLSAKKQLAYGLQIYLSGVINFFYEPLTKIFVANYLGVSAVGFYDIGLKVRSQVMGLATKSIYPLYPTLAQIEDQKVNRFIIHDVEQKLVLVALPIIAIIILTSYAIVSLFFKINVIILSVTIASIVSSYLIGSLPFIPVYLFLLAKGYASKTIIIQATNVIVNIAIILLCVSAIGYYSVVIANALAILSSGVVCLYYQKKYLDSLIFDSYKSFIRVLLVFIISFLAGFVVITFIKSTIWTLTMGPIVVLIICILLYKYWSILNKDDVIRYFGKNNLWSKIVIRTLF